MSSTVFCSNTLELATRALLEKSSIILDNELILSATKPLAPVILSIVPTNSRIELPI